jgi:hypothetical protein
LPNTKPKHYIGVIDAPTLPDGAIDRIVRDGGIPINPEQQKRLEQISIDYLADRYLLDEIPRRSEKKAAIRALHKKAEPFLSALEGLDSHSMEMIAGHMRERVCGGNFPEAVESVRAVLLACETILSEVPDEKGGRSKNTSVLSRFLKKLADLYEEATGKRATASAPNPDNFSKGSPFFHFSKACLEAIGYPPETNFSLQNAIQQALSE